MKSSKLSATEIGLRITLGVATAILVGSVAVLVTEESGALLEGESTAPSSTVSAAELAFEALHAIPGSVVDKSIDIAGKTRNFLVHLPAAYTPATKWPVVMGFHAYGEDAQQLQALAHLERSPAIVVYPNGFNKSWEGAPYSAVGPTEDREFVRAILSDLHENYSVDDARIYAAGLSNGGGFAARLACTMPDVFGAVATVAAANYENNISSCNGQPIPMLMIHGDKDDVINYNGGDRHGMHYWSVREYTDSFLRRNHCVGEPIVYEDEATVRTQWLECTQPVTQITVKGGLHQWFGPVGPVGHEQQDFATTEVLRFFGLM